MVQIIAADETAIDKEELFAPRPTCKLRFADEIVQRCDGGLFIDGYQFFIESRAKQGHNALSQI